ncbi:MAG: ABC transporter permease [Opitutales bacterium]
MKYALRQLAKNPGFTVVALATLTLGIGVNTTAFTVLNRLLLQSLPFRDTGGLVLVWASSSQGDIWAQGSGDFVEERAQSTVFEDMAAYNHARASVAETGKPAVQYGCVFVSANFFPIIGVQPQIGRPFTEDEAKRSEWLTLISNAYWREHYGSAPAVLGRPIRINGRTYTIVGVMPPTLDDPTLLGGPAALFPLDPFTLVDKENRHGSGWYTVTARLKPGVTLVQAQAEMTVVAKRLAHDHPKTNANFGLSRGHSVEDVVAKRRTVWRC